MPAPPIDQQLVFIYSEDPTASIAFYRDVMGLEEVLDQDGQCRIFRVTANSFLGICRRREGRSITRDGVVLSFVTDEVEAWHQHLLAQDVEVLGAPKESTAFKVHGFFARDPDGHLIEFQRFLGTGWPTKAQTNTNSS